MRVDCPECMNRAFIRARNRISNQVTDLYCSCSDPICGHSFVAVLSFKHTLSPSRQTGKAQILDLLRSMDDSEQKELFDLAGRKAPL